MDPNKTIYFKELIFQLIDNKIDKINADPEFFKNISNEDFNKFINALKLNKSIKTLKLIKCDLSQDQYDKIFNIVQNNKVITKLNIIDYNISLYPNINNIYNYYNEINQIDDLNEYKDKINILHNKILQSLINKNPLYNMIQNNINLKKLRLNVSKNFFVNQILINLLKQNKNIISLNLTTTCDLKQLTEILTYNNTITELEIICSLKYINETDFENFCKCIEQNMNLKHLKIWTVKKICINDKINFVKNTLYDALVNNKNIEYITFKGTDFIIKNEHIDFDYIIKILQNNNNIKKIIFKLSNNKNYFKFAEYLKSTNNSTQKIKISYNKNNSKQIILEIKNIKNN